MAENQRLQSWERVANGCERLPTPANRVAFLGKKGYNGGRKVKKGEV